MLKLRITGANLDADVTAAARAALDAAAARLAAQVRQDLATPPGGPHDKPWRQTGALQASIGHRVDGDVATVGSTSPYAAAQEHGTRTVPPRSFLLPAAKRLAPDLARDIGRAVHAALVGEGTGMQWDDPDGIVPSFRVDGPTLPSVTSQVVPPRSRPQPVDASRAIAHQSQDGVTLVGSKRTPGNNQVQNAQVNAVVKY